MVESGSVALTMLRVLYGALMVRDLGGKRVWMERPEGGRPSSIVVSTIVKSFKWCSWYVFCYRGSKLCSSLLAVYAAILMFSADL